MSSGLGGVGFADGFVNGFGMVDAALQRRRANEIEDRKMQQAASADAENRSFKERELGLQGEKYANEAQYNRDHLAAVTANNNAENALRGTQIQGQIDARKSQDKFQNDSLKIQQQNQIRDDQIRASQEKRLADANQMEIETKKFELNAAKADAEKKSALLRISNHIFQKPDGSTGFTLQHGEDGAKQIKDLEVGTGANLEALVNNAPGYKQHVDTMKAALMNPQAFANNKKPVIDALNVLEKNDINQGLGKQEDGTFVQAKSISDILYHPAEEGYPEGYYSFQVKSIGTDANGDYQERDGEPVTQYRSSSQYDQNVRRITPEQLTNRVVGQESILNFVENHPEMQQDIAKRYAANMPKDKKDDKYVDLTNKSETMSQGGDITSNENKVSVNTSTNETYSLGPDGKVVKGRIGSSTNNSTQGFDSAKRTANAQAILKNPNATPEQKKLAEAWLNQ